MKKFLVFSSDNDGFQQSAVSPDATAKLQDTDLSGQSANQRYFATWIYCKNYPIFILHVSLERFKNKLMMKLKDKIV